MRVLVTTWAWPSHCLPLLPQAWALAAAGHDVRVATQPGGLAASLAGGLPGWEVGPPVDLPGLFGRMSAGGAREALRLRAELTGAMLDGLVPLSREWCPDLVLFSPAAQAGPLLAALVGVPSVRLLLGPDFGHRARRSHGGAASEALDTVRGRHGLGDVDLLGTLTLDPCPSGLQPSADYRRQPVRYVPCNGNGLIPAWLTEPAKRPRVCVTLGSTVPVLGATAPSVEELAGELAAVAGEVIVGDPTASVETDRGGASGVRRVGAVPLQLVLPTCDLLVSQAGGGTVLTALLTGTPQLSLPHIADQTFNAACVENAGAGRSTSTSRPSELASVAADMLSDSSYRDAAVRLRDEMATHPTPAEVVGVLEELTG